MSGVVRQAHHERELGLTMSGREKPQTPKSKPRNPILSILSIDVKTGNPIRPIPSIPVHPGKFVTP